MLGGKVTPLFMPNLLNLGQRTLEIFLTIMGGKVGHPEDKALKLRGRWGGV